MMTHSTFPGCAGRHASLLAAIALCYFAVPSAQAASEPNATETTMRVAVVDMQAASTDAVSAKAEQDSRDGVVLVFEGIEPARATEVVRAVTADAIAHGYKVNAAILAPQQGTPRLLIYGVDGLPFGPAIEETVMLDKHAVARAYELGVTRLGGTARVAAAAGKGRNGESAAEAKVPCRVDNALGSRVRKTRFCISDKQSQAQRSALDNTQDRGAPNPTEEQGGG